MKLRVFSLFPWLLLFMLAPLAALATNQEPLQPEKAYLFSASAKDAGTVIARWQITDGYYLYRDKFRFSAEPASVKLGQPKFPAGKFHDDEFFGQVETYRQEVLVEIPVTPGTATTFTLKATSQGCWDQGICFPPLSQQAVIDLGAAGKPGGTAAFSQANSSQASFSQASSAGTGGSSWLSSFTGAKPTVAMDSAGATEPSASPAAPATTANPASPVGTPAPTKPGAKAEGGDESSQIAQMLLRGGFWLNMLSFFGFGLLLCFTPCVFPMVPILSGIIVKHGHAVTHGRAFLLSLAYVLGMAVTYAGVGVAAGFSGTLLSNALQNAWVLGGFALVFVALAFSMFGFYELQLPAGLQSRLSTRANQVGGSFGAIAIMGAVSALIVGPCVAAPLAGALLYIARSGDALLGGAALFSMALGMGAPLLLVGVFSRSLLPKAGPWMDTVKNVFGVILLATALWLATPVLPVWTQMLFWAGLLIVPAIFMHALDPLPPHAGHWQRFWKGLGVLLLIGGAAMLIGVLGGARDPLQPLGFLRASAATTNAEGLVFERVKTLAELESRLRQAAARQQTTMLDYYADWCVTCKEMEKYTFTDARVRAKLAGTLLLQADVTANSADDAALLKRFDLFGPPATLFFDTKGKEIANARVIGYQAADQFLNALAAREQPVAQ